MSSWIQKIKSYVFSGRKYAGKDLQGNKYYEYPYAGIRPKRMVKYQSMVHLSDYTSGKLKLPVQWRAWLTFTRTNPPSLEELQTDQDRLQDLNPRIAAIEERERLERIRQGYAIADGTDPSAPPALGISEPSFTPAPTIPAPHSSINPQYSTYKSRSKTTTPSPTSNPPSPTAAAAATAIPTIAPTIHTSRESGKYHVPTPTSQGVASVKTAVDPSRHASPEELRKLAEEDTKRRIREIGQGEVKGEKGEVAPKQGVEGVGLGGSLKPRRRGGA